MSGRRLSCQLENTAYVKIMRPLSLASSLLVFWVLFSAGDAWAHPGHIHPVDEVDEFDDVEFVAAVVHPFTGVDHLLAMLVGGALAARGVRGLGVAFASAVGLGFVWGMESPPWLLALPLIIVGGFLWKGRPVEKRWVWGAFVLMGFLHGGAHAGGMSGLAAGLGLGAGTLAGVGLGAAAAMALKSLPPLATRFAGASVAITGFLLTVARLSV
jgi:urease accessory protein